MRKMMLDKQSSRRSYPLDAIPFEAFYRGSWHAVERVGVENGCLFAWFDYHGSSIEEKIQGDHIRLRSRKARLFDCVHLLRPGIDVCVLSAQPTTETSDEELQNHLLSWYDAKIISIKRAPKEDRNTCIDRCTCLFSVIFYQNRASTAMRKNTPDRRAEVVTIDSITVLQKLRSEPLEDGFHQWSSSEDCIFSSKSRLLSGAFSTEISWLIVLSTLRGVKFDVKLVQKKIVHLVLKHDRVLYIEDDVQSYGNSYKPSTDSDKNLPIIHFQMCGEILRPKMGNIVLIDSKEMILPDTHALVGTTDTTLDSESDVEIIYDHMNLRHSKRQKIEPDRYISYFPPGPVRRSIRNVAHDINRLELETPTACASETILLIEDEPFSDKLNHTISGNSFKHGESSSIAEVLQRKTRSVAKTSEDQHHPLVIDLETICEDPQILSRLKLKDSCEIARRGREFLSEIERRSKRKKLLSATECKQMIETCMGNIKSKMNKEPQTVPQLEEIRMASFADERLNFNWSPSSESSVEIDEHEDLWKEMEKSLTTLAFLEQKQESNSETVNVSDKDLEPPCLHEYELNEEIGLVCRLCSFIGTERRYILPSFSDGWTTWIDRFTIKGKGWMGPNGLEPCSYGKASWEMSHLEGYYDAWTLIPALKPKLLLHQKNAFEFIWRSIAGSLKPEEMNHLSENVGGCVISHSPGAGKTLLVISFLLSYLKLFPKIRPMILCPKIAIYVWCKEFDKWGFPFPVYQIHPVESYKKEMWDYKTPIFSTDYRKPSRKIMHSMDCLVKLQKWHEHPSIVLMSYPSFSSLAREDSKLEYRRFIADALHESPGILILDEGHNPRSTRSILRKDLMKVKTEFRILLSGTLFQNNFEEYFNTLSLARPRFINDVISKLDPDMVNIFNRRKKKRAKKTNRKEKLARKLFVEKVGQKIESSSEDERKQGFDLLNRITGGFIDGYGGDGSDTLPGLQTYTLLLTSTDLQQEILAKLQRSIKSKRCQFELELLITVGSIHPWLIKTAANANDYFNADELEKIENCKGNVGSGSKAKFVIDLLQKSTVRGERALIFSHNIAPINFLVELCELVFGWAIGEEILVLKGDQELSERARIMDTFNGDDKGRCRVLLASTTACSEGINLVAASRVILLDSEWNHAKTRQAIARAFRRGQERMVYVYRLLASGSWEEEKYNSNAWKSWLAKMIFIGSYFNYSPSKQVEDIDDEILRELMNEDQNKLFQMIKGDVS